MAWIAREDLAALDDPDPNELGPTLRATRDLGIEALVLLSNFEDPATTGLVKRYALWVENQTDAVVQVKQVEVPDPSDHHTIYLQAIRSVEDVQRHSPASRLHFLLSAGTPAMHATWLLLAKSRFHATLVKCSIEAGTQKVELPFEISTDFAADLLERSDEELVRFTQGLPPNAPEFADIIGRCRPMKKAVAISQRLAPRRVSVLLLGESGTGKEVFARAIHRASPRNDKPFIAINCGAIPPELVDSRLFGHKRGAFTGAINDSPGVFEEASGGTLFLDEIGELPLEAQVRLLRVLQEEEIVRVGENKPRKVDLRLVSATHVDLFQAVAEDRFRRDLLYRLAIGIVRLPPLRERGKDVHLLIDHLLKDVQKDLQHQPDFQSHTLSEAARSSLARHSWPGNVRELRTTLLRAALFAQGAAIDRRDIEDSLLPDPAADSRQLLDRPLGSDFDLKALQEELRKHYVSRAMREVGGIKARAAQLLNVSAQTFQHWT